MKRLAIIAALLVSPPALANPATIELCQTLTLTTGSAYTAGNVVGSVTGTAGQSGLIALNSGPGFAGVLESVALDFAEAHTEEYDITPLFSIPINSTFTDKSAPGISATGCSTDTNCDPFLVRTPIKLTNDTALLGSNGTNYSADAIAHAFQVNGGQIAYFVITTPGTPTFTNAKAKFCAAFLKD
jgi:hypothetical protein